MLFNDQGVTRATARIAPTILRSDLRSSYIVGAILAVALVHPGNNILSLN